MFISDLTSLLMIELMHININTINRVWWCLIVDDSSV